MPPLAWLGGPLAKALVDAYKAKLAASSAQDRLVADAVIADIERQMAASRESASVVREGMQHKAKC